jgi:hypothetical protein
MIKSLVVYISLIAIVISRDDSDWASPIDRTDYPNVDIGHYQLLDGLGNCHKCVSLSNKSLFAVSNPDCRAVLFEGAPSGGKNMVEMAQSGRCYEDNPADYATFLGLHSLVCTGFSDNYFECDEHCPFEPDDMEGAIYDNKTYTVFGDSKC